MPVVYRVLNNDVLDPRLSLVEDISFSTLDEAKEFINRIKDDNEDAGIIVNRDNDIKLILDRIP